MGWGFGVAVQLAAVEGGPSVGAYGWDGGLGSTWAVDPVTGTVGVLLANLAWTSPARPPIAEDFWAAVSAATAA
jgi:CubicO group peptidase (beta-lactamase class C family)